MSGSTLAGVAIGAGLVLLILVLAGVALWVGLRLGRRNAARVGAGVGYDTGEFPTSQGFPAPLQRSGTPVEQVPSPYSDGSMPYPDLDNKYQLVGPPTVGNFTLKNWLIHVTGREGIWKEVVQEFYDRAGGHPVVGKYFVGVNMDRLQRHFLQALLIVTDKGLTVGTARRMYEAHLMVTDTAGNGITEEVYDAVVATLGSILDEKGVNKVTIDQTVAVIEPLRDLLIRGEPRAASSPR